jgi:hypothetical protein
MNAAHFSAHEHITSAAAVDLLLRNSAAAALAIRVPADEELDRAALSGNSCGPSSQPPHN